MTDTKCEVPAQQDQAIIRLAIKVLRAWSSWDGHSAEGFWPLVNRMHELRHALATAGYIELGERSAFKAIGEFASQPVTPPQSRGESRDMLVYKWDGMLRVVPYDTRIDTSGERYVPYSQFEAHRRDSELLDAILETAQNLGEESAIQQVWKAIAERAKR